MNYRLIGKGVVEAIGEEQSLRSYLHADRLGSVRMVTDDQGQVVQSVSYDDYGSTRIQGQSYASADNSMASFYRFQGQEQEVFPLARLGIEDEALAAWLDETQLYHFPWRDYAAGLAAFTQTDPIPTEDSLYSALGANPVNNTDETGGVIGTLANIDADTRLLLGRAVSSGTFSLAEGQQLKELLRRVESETFAELESRFGIDREIREMEVSWIRDTEISRVQAMIRRQRGGDWMTFGEDHEAIFHRLAIDKVRQNPSGRLARAEWELHQFVSTNESWLAGYVLLRQAWLENYSDAIRHLNLADDQNVDDEDDEKASEVEWTGVEWDLDGNHDPVPPPASEQANEVDANSDDEVMIGFPTGGAANADMQDAAPAPHADAVAPNQEGLPLPILPEDENHRVKCCNIL